MNEIKRLQQLAGILSEIRVNKPMDYEKIWDECWGQALDEVGEFSGGNDFEDEEVENESEVSEYARELFKQRTGKEYDDLNEDVSDFNIGQSSETGGRRTTVTDIDPETQSVTWSVKKEVDDSTIHKDLSDLINKFEKVQLKDFHSRPKLIQLVKDLKSIRNKFSRTVVKEDKQRLEKTLRGILNEIKVNKPVNRLEDIEEILKGKMLLLAGLFRKYFNGWSMGEKSHESKTYYNKLSYEDKLNMYQDAIRLSKGETI